MVLIHRDAGQAGLPDQFGGGGGSRFGRRCRRRCRAVIGRLLGGKLRREGLVRHRIGAGFQGRLGELGFAGARLRYGEGKGAQGGQQEIKGFMFYRKCAHT